MNRSKQELPEQIVCDLLQAIRGQFCPDLPKSDWYKAQPFLKRVVTYPAAWLDKRGVTLPPKRYKAILLDIFNTIKLNGKTEAVQYWPGYLLHCVQEHFKHHGEGYYNEGKNIRALTERNMMAFDRAAKPPEAADPIPTMAQAYCLLTKTKGGRPKKKAAPQPEFKF